QIKSQAELQQVLEQPDNAATLIDDAINTAAQDHLADYSPVLRRLETERAQRLLPEWLQFEAQRPAFTVLGREHSVHWSYDALDLNLRIDRIDQLETGCLAVIDYKTGSF